MSNKICVGLFGTCGNSTWRQEFIPYLEAAGIQYFNPQKDNWQEDDAINEARHLVNDDVVLFPVTNETYGTGSLAETGYSIMQAIKSSKQRAVVIFIDPTLDPILKSNDPVAAKESMRSRALVIEHLKNINDPRVYVVDSMEDMFKVGLKLAQVSQIVSDIRNGIGLDLPPLATDSLGL